MKKQFLNLGKALNKAEQIGVNGGAGGFCDGECTGDSSCGSRMTCVIYNMTYSCPDDPMVGICMPKESELQ